MARKDAKSFGQVSPLLSLRQRDTIPVADMTDVHMREDDQPELDLPPQEEPSVGMVAGGTSSTFIASRGQASPTVMNVTVMGLNQPTMSIFVFEMAYLMPKAPTRIS